MRSSLGVYVTVYLHNVSQHSMRLNWGTSAGILNLPHNLAHLDAARLVEQQHSARTLFLGLDLPLRGR